MSKTAAAAAISTKCGFTNGAAELLHPVEYPVEYPVESADLPMN